MLVSIPFFYSIVAAMGGLLFGYDWVVIGGAKPFFEKYLRPHHAGAGRMGEHLRPASAAWPGRWSPAP